MHECLLTSVQKFLQYPILETRFQTADSSENSAKSLWIPTFRLRHFRWVWWLLLLIRTRAITSRVTNILHSSFSRLFPFLNILVHQSLTPPPEITVLSRQHSSSRRVGRTLLEGDSRDSNTNCNYRAFIMQKHHHQKKWSKMLFFWA